LNFGTLETLECHRRELTFDFLHDLHNEELNNEESYIQKMLMSTSNGGLWGDFTTIF
jgi:hypothetical protein